MLPSACLANRYRLSVSANNYMVDGIASENFTSGSLQTPLSVDATEEFRLIVRNRPATIQAEKAARRSVYLYVKRAFKMSLFDIFDAPDTTVSCARRQTTNVAPQALALMNNRFVLEQAGLFADRLKREGGDHDSQVRRAWDLALSRPPTDAEKQRAL